MYVIDLLGQDTMRFTELHRGIGGITARMLTVTLRGLERDGLVSRTVFPTVPPRVDYAVTDLGRTLISPLWNLYCWARDNRCATAEARQRFDSAR
jgi:DNA-binding HxlR family transcriptional regulator